jgi:hypothetical protein
MKLVIQTQIRENYAAHTGFTGEFYWKMKGGNTYIVENLSEYHAEKIVNTGIPTLSNLITEKNNYFEEYVISYSVVEDDAVACEEWETPTFFYWGGDRWLASRTTNNDEYGYMRSDIKKKREQWIPLEAGERSDYKCEYLMPEGWVSSLEAA